MAQLSRPAGAAAPLLEVEGLCVDMLVQHREPKRVVADVSFAVREGEMLGIVGGSGSGKTTTLRTVLKRLPRAGRVAAGQVRFRGQDVLALPEEELRRIRGRQIAIIVQNPIAALNPLRRVEDQIIGFARQHDLPLDSAAVARHLQDVGISDPARVLRAYPHELSGGMAQRILIAAAIALEPSLILADEPTSALDVTIQAQIMELLRRLVAERGVSIVFVTHDIALVAEYCDRVVVMKQGRIVEQGTVATVIHQPVDPYTIDLVDSARPLLIDHRGKAS